jgi:hypothetical protein
MFDIWREETSGIGYEQPISCVCRNVLSMLQDSGKPQRDIVKLFMSASRSIRA